MIPQTKISGGPRFRVYFSLAGSAGKMRAFKAKKEALGFFRSVQLAGAWDVSFHELCDGHWLKKNPT
jgi:hypothetical protein